MYFKRLEVVGFKSFYEKTVLHFEPGITAVVGPNGSGKSNLYDAICWVLGEQSAKTLRGSEMQDVIFNGTDLKEPLSMAEATLIFDNSQKYFNIDHQEVAVTRRIFRSGESEYLLNKTQVRLKDILDLMLGTGIGAQSYSLVQQGKIDLILSSRPEDRRLVFDEAAGITRYKAQKKEALRKLEETEQNLLRVNDIILEVKRQIGSLERQANKARRYKEAFEELKLKEIHLASLKKQELLKEKDELVNSLKDLEIREARLLKAITDEESKTSGRKDKLKALEEGIAKLKTEILNLENLIARNNQRISLSKERKLELETNKLYLESQIEQAKNRLRQDEEKLSQLKQDHAGLNKNIEEKTLLLQSKEAQLNQINSDTRLSLEKIAETKRNIFDLAAKITNLKNTVVDLLSKQQIYLARKNRLEVEKAKVNEEKTVSQANLNEIKKEVEALEKDLANLAERISTTKKELEQEVIAIEGMDSEIEAVEKKNLTLLSQKEFVEKLKTEYEGKADAMNALIFLDRLPEQKISGLVVRVDENITPEKESAGFKFAGEAKPFALNTAKLNQEIEQLQEKLDSLKAIKQKKHAYIEALHQEKTNLEGSIRQQEIALADKKAQLKTLQAQFDKISEENELIGIELAEVHNELSTQEEKISRQQAELNTLEKEEQVKQDCILSEQNSISSNHKLKEDVLVIIAQTETQLDALHKRIDSDEANLKNLESACALGEDNLSQLKIQLDDSSQRGKSLELEISNFEKEILDANQKLQNQAVGLKEAQDRYKQILDESSATIEKVRLDRTELDTLKNKLHELEMHNKDVDFKYLNIKERIQQAYKVDLDILGAQEAQADVKEIVDANILSQEIQSLKEKLDAYGTVNLVAIEEYDELKKRYDFLTQQQNDLVSAKNSLHEAILKINRTTRKMFLETFEKVCVEFRNYFKLLFNGGDAQLFLIDESDPLESGIEIICRPPGKKLQNVLLLSGGEKSMSAIALIFAIFKVKPAPFCILDEIDAALDEANVDRFSRILQEFVKNSQFIVITHNKRTIANADVMYGITMEESGVSKIVSVKFSQNKVVKDRDEELATKTVAEPV